MQKKQILSASDVIASIMINHLKVEIIGEESIQVMVAKESLQAIPGDKLHRLDYYSVMIGLMTVLLVDGAQFPNGLFVRSALMKLLERTMQNTLHTVLLLSFQRAGGLETIFDICSVFLDSIESVTSVRLEERSEPMVQELVHAQGGLKVALHLLYPLISSKALFESGQTILVMTRDKKDTDADYFEPHHFLVRLRLTSVSVLQRIWESSWLRSAPLTLVKSVVQLVLELTTAENEELKGEPPVEGISGAGSAIGVAAGLNMRNTGPDENRIRQLTDMGFPRSAAERALARTHNNVSAATDLLLSHPLPLPPDPEPESDTQQDGVEGGLEQPAEPTDEDAEESTTRDEEMGSEEVTSSAPPEAPAEPVSSEQGKGLEELRQELNATREPLKSNLTRQALLLVDDHPSLIFEVHKTFLRPSPDLQELSIRSLIDDIKEYSPGALDVQEEPLATRCRLLALVLSECPTLEPSIGRNLMDCLLALLLSNSSAMEPDHATPKWLASHLLVTEALLNIGDQPIPVVLPKEGDPVVPQDLNLGPPYPDARSIVFDFCIRLLALPNLPRDEFLAVLRLLVVLSRDHSVASKFVGRDGISLVFKHLKGHGGAGSYSYIAIILRHVAEDLHALQGTMRQEIKRFLSQPRTRIVDVSSFVRNCTAVALRNPESFIEVIQSICQLQQPYSAIQHISLKPDVAEDSNRESLKPTDMQVDSPIDVPRAPSNEALESVVHLLIGELMRAYKPPDGSADTLPQLNKQAAPAVPTEQSSAQMPMVPPDTPSEQERYAHSCFLMQCLSELLFSYDACKLAFLSYNPKKQRQQTPSKDGKHRTAVLQFFLTELVTYGTITAQPDAKARLHLCTWAMSVLVALCVDCSPGAEAKEVPADLVSIRKFALDAISRAIKETLPSENMDARYGRLLALTDLCNRLLTVRFSNSGSKKPPEESTTHIAKIMLEKNFVATLTNALGEVDLNFPNIRNLVASVLRPLENL